MDEISESTNRSHSQIQNAILLT